MRTPTKLGLAALVIGATFAFGFRLGVHVGAPEYAMMESSVKAALIAGELRAMCGGTTDKLIAAKEAELDGEVVKALRYREEGQPWMFWPFSAAYDHKRYLDGVARYRREHSAPTPSLDFGQSEPMRSEMATYAREVQRRTDQLTSTYGK
jgi:hypothetical protein